MKDEDTLKTNLDRELEKETGARVNSENGSGFTNGAFADVKGRHAY